ncbi:hypothetical protein RJ640_029752 [Escallonia rubra]|uniref:Uncharacterized protein n=1 Tax=Escallonia rubra TaxID=112253 RepID=A0AA88QT98_9ASTE|nr:hypothetical protein RJ640_029752 [Escallonia rubra]
MSIGGGGDRLEGRTFITSTGTGRSQLPPSFIRKHFADYENKEKTVLCDIDGIRWTVNFIRRKIFGYFVEAGVPLFMIMTSKKVILACSSLWGNTKCLYISLGRKRKFSNWLVAATKGRVKRSQAQKNRGVNLNAVKINQLLKKKARALSIAIAKWEDGFHFRKVGSESAYTQGPVKRSQAQHNRGVKLSAVKINQLLRKKARALFIAIAKCEDGFHSGK